MSAAARWRLPRATAALAARRAGSIWTTGPRSSHRPWPQLQPQRVHRYHRAAATTSATFNTNGLNSTLYGNVLVGNASVSGTFTKTGPGLLNLAGNTAL